MLYTAYSIYQYEALCTKVSPRLYYIPLTKRHSGERKRWCVVVVASQTANAFDHCRHISDVAFAGHTVSKNSFTFSKQRFRHDFMKCIWIIGILHTWHNCGLIYIFLPNALRSCYIGIFLIDFFYFISRFLLSTILYTFS